MSVEMEYQLASGVQYEVDNGFLGDNDIGRIFIDGITYHKFEWQKDGSWTSFGLPVSPDELSKWMKDEDFLTAFTLFREVSKAHITRRKHRDWVKFASSTLVSIKFAVEMTTEIAKRICAEERAYDEALIKLDNLSIAVFEEANRVWRPFHGYVYLTDELEGCHKIGLSFDPIRRIRELGAKLPRPLVIEHLIECRNCYETEAHLHKRYAAKRAGGEWFKLTAADIEAIKSITEL